MEAGKAFERSVGGGALMTREQILSVIDQGNFGAFVGETENEFFDCKSAVYDLNNSSQKLELAKDVSSFANEKGGFIIIGITTKKDPTHIYDEIEALQPIPRSMFNEKRYFDVLNSWIYPKIEKLHVDWKPDGSQADKGFGVIAIPQQPNGLRPFLINHSVVGSKKQSQIVFGYVVRKGDVQKTCFNR